MSTKTSTINIDVSLDDEQIPQTIHWAATDQQGASTQEAKAMLLAFFDKDSKDTLKIDLWTKEMQVIEMDRFFYQTLRALGDTYKRATSNTKLAESMQQFAQYFGEQTEILGK